MVVTRLFSALQRLSETAELEGIPCAEDFDGDTTKQLTGRIADAYQGRAKSDLVKKWCAHRKLQVTKRYGLKDWTEGGPLVMCLEWCERM